MANSSQNITREELHLAWARVPNTAGIGAGFDAALKVEAINHCLTRMALLRRRRVPNKFNVNGERYEP